VTRSEPAARGRIFCRRTWCHSIRNTPVRSKKIRGRTGSSHTSTDENAVPKDVGKYDVNAMLGAKTCSSTKRTGGVVLRDTRTCGSAMAENWCFDRRARAEGLIE